MGRLKKVGILTSGGDAPGMNAAIRAVVRAAICSNMEVVGIMQGFHGMINNIVEPMNSRSVSNIIHKGGTILKSARSQEFRTPEGRKQAFDNLVENGIDSLVVIGGDGTFNGARIFSSECNIPIVGIPGTIDNDLYGTDYTIGYDTALNTVVEAVDKIRDTAHAHSRIFFVEVMGRDAGFLALRSGIASGAEAILVPEIDMDYKQLYEYLEKGHNKDKSSSIVIVAEGEKINGGAIMLSEKIKKEYPSFDPRVTILGHIQRGGSPSAFDRVTASRMGVSAIEALNDGQRNVMLGLVNKEITLIPFNQALKHKKQLNPGLLELTRVLSI
ncbi:6-phosphofructokinase [Saccharicrinis carchari]|uniref:ATP-dependent 6-phosphofructokinase n=1 Tax=Saccharicrinis carchari TaxID=1168039 RepID=A0A521DBR3_SACCC|nr:6-phosphofructokinase [Saccharicrinis carchari]SMO69012.1 6-phosphofructokinase [Saccharicrinis carchari]